jgi:hypothetical protein
MALAAMALDHAAASVVVSLQAETYGGQPAHLLGWPYWVTGLFTNLAAPTFWLLSGTSITLFAEGKRRQGMSEWAITRHLLIRALVIIFLDLTICQLFWAGNGPYLHVLTSIGVGLALMSILRLLPNIPLLILITGIMFVYQVALPVWGIQLSQTTNFPIAFVFTYSTKIWPSVEFSILGWAPLMGIGLLLGRKINTAAFQRARNWFGIGLALLLAWFVMRQVGGFGDLTPYTSDQPWYFFFIMSKTPPSFTYLFFNLGISALVMGLLVLSGSMLSRKPLLWIVIAGQVALFFFVLHIVVYGIMGRFIRLIEVPVPGVVLAVSVWGLGLMLLLPMTIMYRNLRKRYPESVLKFL